MKTLSSIYSEENINIVSNIFSRSIVSAKAREPVEPAKAWELVESTEAADVPGTSGAVGVLEGR